MYKVTYVRKMEDKKSLKAFLNVYETDKRLHINDCTLFSNNGKTWINLPQRTYKNDQGETKYAPIVRLEKEDMDAFTKEVLNSLKEYDPNAAKQGEEKKKTSDQFELPF